MSNPRTPPHIKIKTKDILIKNYINYTLSLSYNFQKKLRTKKYLIGHGKDLHQYAINGLVKAVSRYNYKYSDSTMSLQPYIKKYILGYLYYGITELSPLKQLSHYERYTKKIKLPPTHLTSDIWFYDNIMTSESSSTIESKTESVYYKIQQLTPIQKQILFYRYDAITLEKKRTWSEVAELMSYSSETIRKRITKIKDRNQRSYPKNFI
jgi:RNA polymerase sigma factor (sigma-70 family)